MVLTILQRDASPPVGLFDPVGDVSTKQWNNLLDILEGLSSGTERIHAGAFNVNAIVDADISTHTSTKITITAKPQLNANIAYKDETLWLTTAMVGDDQITFGKTQNIATARILGRNTAGSGDIEELTAATTKSLLAIVRADISDLFPIVDADIGVHTSTKITITAKSQLNSAIVYNDQNNNFGDFFQDFGDIATPANPAAGVRRLFVDTGTGKLSVRTSAGVTVSLEESGGGSQTPWTSDIDADGFDLNDLSNILFRSTTGAPASTDRAQWYDDTAGMIMNALTGDYFSKRINGAEEYRLDATDFDFFGNNLRNAGFLETNAANPASAGAIRLGNTEGLRWRNAANSADVGIDVNASDEFVLVGTTTLDQTFIDKHATLATVDPAADYFLVLDATDSIVKRAIPNNFGLGGGSAHALLSTTHNDTVVNAVTRGSIIFGNSTPAWDELVKGADGTVLQSDSLDALWRTSLKLAEISEPSAPAANQVEIYNFNSGGIGHVLSKDEYGLIDQFGVKDTYRFKNKFFLGLGSDLAVTATDCLAKGWAATLEGTVSNQVSATEAIYKRFATAATLDTDGGAFSTSFVWLSRNQNPDVTIKFAAESSAVRRCWIGFVEADHMASDATAATHKFALRLSTSPAVTGFTIVHSDGTTEVVESQIQASDTAFHTIRLIGDNANSRWGYSFDGAAIVWITTNIPSASQKMGLQVQMRTLEAVAKNMAIQWIDGTADK